MKPVFRGATGDRRGERGGPGLEVRARAEYRVGVDHRAGIAPGDVLAEVRLVDGVVVDTGVGGDHVHATQRRDQLALLADLGRVLAEALAVSEVDAAGIGRRWYGTAGADCGVFLDPGEAAVAHHLDVAHHVDVADRHEALRAPEAADFDLVFERAPRGFAVLAGEDGALLARQVQGPTRPCR